MTTINMTADIAYTDPDDIITVIELAGFTNVAISLPQNDEVDVSRAEDERQYRKDT